MIHKYAPLPDQAPTGRGQSIARYLTRWSRLRLVRLVVHPQVIGLKCVVLVLLTGKGVILGDALIFGRT